MEVQEVLAGAPRFSVSVSNGSVMVVPLPQGQGAEAAQLHQIPTHVLNEQVWSKGLTLETNTHTLIHYEPSHI